MHQGNGKWLEKFKFQFSPKSSGNRTWSFNVLKPSRFEIRLKSTTLIFAFALILQLNVLRNDYDSMQIASEYDPKNYRQRLNRVT
jgi:hypothetical protein